MDLHELGLAAAEVASIEAALADARRSVAEAEAERQRLVAEGPAPHRKKDVLDKVGQTAFRLIQPWYKFAHFSNANAINANAINANAINANAISLP